MWIPELLLRMETRDCHNATVAPDTRMFNATNVAWTELTKLHDGYAKPELIAFKTNVTRVQDSCNDNIDEKVKITEA